MRKIVCVVCVALLSALSVRAGVAVTVPKGWKGRTLYLKQTDIHSVVSGEELVQLRDTLTIDCPTFHVPIRLDGPTWFTVLRPAADETDFDRKVGVAFLLPTDSVSMTLDDGVCRMEGTELNRQIGEIWTHIQPIQARWEQAYVAGDRERVAALARENAQWLTDYIEEDPSRPGAAYALYELSDPERVVALSRTLCGEAVRSLFYPIARIEVRKMERILERRAGQAAMNDGRTIAPDFELEDFAGGRVSLRDFRGRWVVLDFWGSWCAPCLKNFPELKEIYAAHCGEVEIVGVCCNDSPKAWRAAVERFELPWVSLFQPKGGRVAADYRVSAYPTKVIVDPQGGIRKAYSGESPTFREELEALLKGDVR